MKRRHAYVILFAIPAFIASAIVAGIRFGAVAGGLWLFAFGDNPWPKSADTVLVTAFALVFLTTWLALLRAAYAYGRRHEDEPAFNARHIWASAGATALLVLLVVAHQRGVGNIGPKDNDTLCLEFCQAKGYSGSGMPPRNSGDTTCSCYGAQGREAAKASIEEIRKLQRK
jgi:hypothetical protein